MSVRAPRPPWRVVRPVPIALAVAALGLAGCDPADETGASLLTGAKLTTSAKAVEADGEVVLDIAGSELSDTAKDTCPRVAYFFLDDAEGVDAQIAPLETLKTDKGCQVTRGQLRARLKGGTPGSTRQQRVSVRIEGIEPGRLVASRASETIEVRTPGTAPGPGTSPPPTTPTTPTTPPPPDEPVRFTCTPGAPVVPPQFSLNFDLNPGYGNTGSPSFLDVSRTTSTGGGISEYAWDYDGDGTADRVAGSPVLSVFPREEKLYVGCLRVKDTTGAVATHETHLAVQNTAGQVGPFTVTPASPKIGDVVTVEPSPGPTGTSSTCVYFFEPADGTSDSDCAPPYTHTFATAGSAGFINVIYDIDADGDPATFEDNRWGQGITVRGAGGRATVRAAKKGKKKAPKSVSLTVPMTGPSKVVRRGKVTMSGSGQVDVKDAIITGRMTAKLSKKARKAVPAALSFLLSADHVTKMSGRRVLLDPQTEGLAGKGRLLARSTKDKKTLVCLSVTTNGGEDTTWKILGATGRARGWVGGGKGTPPTTGPGAAKRTASLTLKRGKVRGIGDCGALKGKLPATKKGKK